MSRENAYFCNVQLHAVCHVKVKLVLNQAEQASVNIRLRVVRSYFPANNIINQQKSECFTQSPAFLQCWTAQKTAGCPVGRPGAARAQPCSGIKIWFHCSCYILKKFLFIYLLLLMVFNLLIISGIIKPGVSNWWKPIIEIQLINR